MLRDLTEFFDPTLRLPMKGKVYVVESPEAGVGIHIQRLFNTATAAFAGAELSTEDLAALELDDAEEQDLYPRVLGATYREMVDDGLPWVWIKHAGTTALMWIGLGIEAAENFWEEAPQGEARRPVPQDRKAPAKKASPKTGTRSRRPAASRATSKTTPPDPLASP
jgi:hypothetical protein